MDIEIYKNFLTIVNTSNITQAAEELHITQSALSKQIRMLEDFYGCELILSARGRQKIILTEAGRILYEKASHICNLAASAKDELQDVKAGLTGTLRLSIAYSRSTLLMERTLKDFALKYPKITFDIKEAIAAEQTQQLLNGISELGITLTNLSSPDYFEVLFSRPETLSAVFNANIPFLPAKSSLNLEDLKELPLSISEGVKALFQAQCQEAGFAPQIVSSSTTKSTSLLWAVHNIYVAIVPSEPGETYGSRLVVKPITDKNINFRKNIVRVKGRPLSNAAQLFLDFYKEQRFKESKVNN